jgi:CRISPR-associated protein Csc3
VFLDAPHPFTRYALGVDRIRVDQLEHFWRRLMAVYDVNLDAFAKAPDPAWNQVSLVAREMGTDPLAVFSLFERYERNAESGHQGGIPPRHLRRYMEIYRTMGGEERMGFIGPVVDAYAVFYRTRSLDSAHAVLRPLGTALKVIEESAPSLSHEDLVLLVAGAVNDDMERVRGGQAEGFNPILRSGGPALTRVRVGEFAEIFVTEVFEKYCEEDRALLRERANRLRSAARFYYLSQYVRRKEGENGQS